MTIDRSLIQEFARNSAGHLSSNGVITMFHELYHQEKAFAADWANFSGGAAEAAAQAYGESVYNEATDATKATASAIVTSGFMSPAISLLDPSAFQGCLIDGVWTSLQTPPRY